MSGSVTNLFKVRYYFCSSNADTKLQWKEEVFCYHSPWWGNGVKKSFVRDRQPRRRAAVSQARSSHSSQSGGKTNLTLRVIDWQEKKQDTNHWSKRANVQNWTTVPSHFLPILCFLFDISGLAAFWDVDLSKLYVEISKEY